MSSYAELARDAAATKVPRDLTHAWSRLTPLPDVSEQVRANIATFAASKRISLDALEQLDTRLRVPDNGTGSLELAWATRVRGVVTAVKFRPLGNGRRRAEAGSVFVEPIVVGDRASLDWFVAEGETDGCRLYDLVGDVAAVMVLPAGALTFKPEWAAAIPRGATVHLAHDADEPGDEGAAKAAKTIGGRTVRVRPPDDGTDWCDWEGGRSEFVELVHNARAQRRSYRFVPLRAFLTRKFPEAEPLLGKPSEIYLARGTLLLAYGADGSGKSTWSVDGMAHMAAGADWLGIHVPRPVRFCVIENEGPPSLFQQKIADKAASWDGSTDWQDNVVAYEGPWGEFTFADPDARADLTQFCDEHEIDVVTANPTLGLGVAGSGRPDETQQFVDWLVECGLKTTRAFWLLHHENKAGQISGDWGRHPDTKVQLQADGKQPRTRLVWEKTRWATLPTEKQPKACMLEWIVETKGYRVLEIDTTGARDDELTQRIRDYLDDHPLAPTNSVTGDVEGNRQRISNLLKTGDFDCVKGPRSSKLWFNPSDRVQEPDAQQTQ